MKQVEPSIEQLERRIASLRRAYGRGLARRPTAIEEAAMQRAAVLSARAEAAALDPAVTVNDCVRMDGCASRARQAMFALIGAKPATKLGPDALKNYVRDKYATASA